MQVTESIHKLENYQKDILSSLSIELNELTHLVLSFLSPSDLSNCQLVCKKWKELASAPFAWIEATKSTLGLNVKNKEDLKKILLPECEVHSMEELIDIINRLFELLKKGRTFAIQYQSDSNPDCKFFLIGTPDRLLYLNKIEEILPIVKIQKNIKGKDEGDVAGDEQHATQEASMRNHVGNGYCIYKSLNPDTEKCIQIESQIYNQKKNF